MRLLNGGDSILFASYHSLFVNNVVWCTAVGGFILQCCDRVSAFHLFNNNYVACIAYCHPSVRLSHVPCNSKLQSCQWRTD